MNSRVIVLIAISSILATVSACAHPAKSDQLVEAYGNLVGALGDSSLSMWQKETARLMLVQGDKDVIPVLISALNDERTFDPEYLSPSGAVDSKPRILTVGQACEMILYRIISGIEPRRYRVSDWASWWDRNQTMNLGEIREMVRANSEPIK